MNGRGPEVAHSRGRNVDSRVPGLIPFAGAARTSPDVRELIAETGPRIAKDRAHAACRQGPEALTSDLQTVLACWHGHCIELTLVRD
jgi:hypothetical protein